MDTTDKNIIAYRNATRKWSCMNTIILLVCIVSSFMPSNIPGFFFYVPGQSVVPIYKAILGLIAVLLWIVSFFFFGYCCYKAYKIKKAEQRIVADLIFARRVAIGILLGFYSFMVAISGAHLGSYNYADFWENRQYYEYECDEHTIVICETSQMMTGGIHVYQVEDCNIAYEIGRCSTDDGYQNDGKYELKWDENGLYIGYYFDHGYGEELKKEAYFEWIDWEELWNS